MDGITWMDSLLKCEQTRTKLPLELQASLPLPGRQNNDSVECWYYRIKIQEGEVQIYSPERYVLWNAKTLEIQNMKCMEPALLGSGADLMTKEHREREDAFLLGVFTDFLNGVEVKQEVINAAWLAAMPEALRKWMPL